MLSLITKDLLTITKHKMYFVMVAIFILVPDAFLGSFAIIFVALLPITSIAYDERSKWRELESMMPYSKKDSILSKYVLGYLLILIVGILSYLIHLVLSILVDEYQVLTDVSVIISAVSIALIMIALNLPFIFKLGIEKGRFLFIGLVAVVTVVGTNVNILGGDIYLNKYMYIYLFLLAIAINIVSIYVSLKINYKICRN